MALGHALRTLTTGARVGKQALLGRATNPVPTEWQHITKVDPEEAKRLPICYPFYLQHTDAISVGGSRSVTAQNTKETFALLDISTTPSFHEPSEATHVSNKTREQAAFIAIPEVLNGQTDALVGTLGKGLEYLNDNMLPELIKQKLPWPVRSVLGDTATSFAMSWFLDQAVFEAYIVQNPDSAAARQSGVTADNVLTPEIARQRALVADRHLKSEVIYIEYSGTYGAEEAIDIVDAVADDLTRARLWYGGGIDTREKSQAMLAAGADTVIVGDVFHDIATEEIALVRQAAKALDPESPPDTINQWIKQDVDIGSTHAVKYLRTIPSVTAPKRVARRYLTLTIGLYLAARATAQSASADMHTAGTTLLKAVLPAPTDTIKSIFKTPATTWQRYLTEIVLPAVTTSQPTAPVHHLSTAPADGSM